MENQIKLLMTAARQVVDAELALSKAQDDAVFARAQFRALTSLVKERAGDHDEATVADTLRAVAEVDQALSELAEVARFS